MMDDISKKMGHLWRMVKADKKYADMNYEFLQLEDQFALIISRLPEKEQDAAWGYVCLSGAMNWRIMEIVCENMNFTSDLQKGFARN